MTHRAHLNRAAAHVAAQLGLVPTPTSPWDGWKDTPAPRGYFRLTWFLMDAAGITRARLMLDCQGGYGAGTGTKSWFAGFVSVDQIEADGRPGACLSIQRLVHQWDYPEDGLRSAKATRARFLPWAQAFQAPPAKAG